MVKPKALDLALSCLFLLYPLVVYWGVSRYGAKTVALPLLALVAVRFLLARKSGLSLSSVNLWLLLAACTTLLIGFAANSALSLKLYPICVSLTLLTLFALSLRSPPTVIEKMARLTEPDLSDAAIRYTRKVTWVWCVFFVGNATLSALTLWMPDHIWALYNGLIAYVLMGALFAGEFVIRQRVKRHG